MEYVKCNLCGSDDYRKVYEGIKSKDVDDLTIKYKSSSNIIGNQSIVKCNNCGLVYINPRIESEDIIKGYSEGSDERFISQAKGREVTFERSLRFLEKHSGKGKILDIGTAGGSFLFIAKKRGWEVYGVEPNKWLCEWGKKNYGLDIKQGTIFDIKYPDEFFDVVTLWDVLEHVHDPKSVLVECNRILKKRGLLVINYPDIGSFISKIMGGRWIFLLSVHLYYFTSITMSKMLQKTGFRLFLTKPHIQTLSLGYLVERIDPYSKKLYLFTNKIIKTLRIGGWQVPYWLGQTLVLAEKNE